TLAGGDGNDTFILGSTQGATTTIDGGNGTDTVQGANVANTWTISGAGAGNVNGIVFSNVESLTGGTANDTFNFCGSGSIAGAIDGGTGTNTLDYSLYATGVTVNLLAGTGTGIGTTIANIQNLTGSPQNDSLTGNASNNTISGFGGVDTIAGGDGNDSFRLGATQGAGTTVDGGNGTDTLQGTNATNAWQITGANAGNISGISFVNTESLLGGTGSDTFTFSSGASLAGTVNGGGGTDALDYS